ncbi:Hypothetical_protein [Hexamita inflata]|uniref:Hypothetical_protein n=1 Tax=Hexamita inflata TaxID=28002 RepID=A0AA86N738_9EUKA|nr:Hypothetical protein HINF_LOCUS1793 [Hexamita inflata]CAI9914149.1 Hypothetical protein HINF_LOCUS1794 [Hexamita inflata]
MTTNLSNCIKVYQNTPKCWSQRVLESCILPDQRAHYLVQALLFVAKEAPRKDNPYCKLILQSEWDYCTFQEKSIQTSFHSYCIQVITVCSYNNGGTTVL